MHSPERWPGLVWRRRDAPGLFLGLEWFSYLWTGKRDHAASGDSFRNGLTTNCAGILRIMVESLQFGYHLNPSGSQILFCLKSKYKAHSLHSVYSILAVLCFVVPSSLIYLMVIISDGWIYSIKSVGDGPEGAADRPGIVMGLSPLPIWSLMWSFQVTISEGWLCFLRSQCTCSCV